MSSDAERALEQARRLDTSTVAMLKRWRMPEFRDELGLAPAAVRGYVEGLEAAVLRLGDDQPVGSQRVGWRARLAYVEQQLGEAVEYLAVEPPRPAHALPPLHRAHEAVQAMIDGNATRFAAAVDRHNDDPESADAEPDPGEPSEADR